MSQEQCRCGAKCFYLESDDIDEDPCEGKVQAIDETWSGDYIHVCEHHIQRYWTE